MILIRQIWRIMNISPQLTDAAILQELGGRLTQSRIEHNLTQAALALLLPEPTLSPMAQLQQQGRKRQRATGKRTTAGAPKKWTWGETP